MANKTLVRRAGKKQCRHCGIRRLLCETLHKLPYTRKKCQPVHKPADGAGAKTDSSDLLLQ